MTEAVSDGEFIKAIQGIGDFDTEEERCDEAYKYLETKEYYGMEPDEKLSFMDNLIRIVKENDDEALKRGMRAIACKITKGRDIDEEERNKARELCEAAGGSNVVALVGTLRRIK